MKNIVILLVVIVLSKFAMANPVTNPTSAAIQWNLQQQQLGGQLEYDKRRTQQNQYYAPREPKYTRWSVFVYNDETGHYDYVITEPTTGTSGSIVNSIKKQLEKKGVKTNKDIRWKGNDGGFAVVVMGQNIKTNKWEVYFEKYFNQWAKVYKASEITAVDFEVGIEKKLLNKCSEKAKHCQVVYNIKKLFNMK